MPPNQPSQKDGSFLDLNKRVEAIQTIHHTYQTQMKVMESKLNSLLLLTQVPPVNNTKNPVPLKNDNPKNITIPAPTSFLTAVKDFPPKIQKGHQKVIGKPIKKKIPQSKMMQKKIKSTNWNQVINVFLSKDVELDFIQSVLDDIAGNYDTASVPKTRPNVIQIFTNNQKDFKKSRDIIHQKLYDICKGLYSSGVFLPNEYTLIHTTKVKEQHYSALKRFTKLTFAEEPVDYDQVCTTYHNKIYTFKVSLRDKQDMDLVKTKLGFEIFRSDEQILAETPDTLAQLNFNSNYSEEAIMKGVNSILKKGNIVLNSEKCISINKIVNRTTGEKYTACKLTLPTKENLRVVVNIKQAFQDKFGRLIIRSFKATRDHYESKVVKKYKKNPELLNNSIHPIVTKVMDNLTNSSTNSSELGESDEMFDDGNKSESEEPSVLEKRVEKIETSLQQTTNEMLKLQSMFQNISNMLGSILNSPIFVNNQITNVNNQSDNVNIQSKVSSDIGNPTGNIGKLN